MLQLNYFFLTGNNSSCIEKFSNEEAKVIKSKEQKEVTRIREIIQRIRSSINSIPNNTAWFSKLHHGSFLNSESRIASV